VTPPARPVVLTPPEYVEVVAALDDLRRLGQELARVFADAAGPAAPPTRGAEAMVATVDSVLAILRARADF
jgi:hypothetical protein